MWDVWIPRNLLSKLDDDSLSAFTHQYSPHIPSVTPPGLSLFRAPAMFQSDIIAFSAKASSDTSVVDGSNQEIESQIDIMGKQ